MAWWTWVLIIAAAIVLAAWIGSKMMAKRAPASGGKGTLAVGAARRQLRPGTRTPDQGEVTGAAA